MEDYRLKDPFATPNYTGPTVDYTGGFDQAAAQSQLNSPIVDRPEDAGNLQSVQGLLGYMGLIPGIGEPFDLVNAGLYGLQGDYKNAALYGSGLGLLGAGSLKYANKARDAMSPVMRPSTARYGISTGLQESGGEGTILSSIPGKNQYKAI